MSRLKREKKLLQSEISEQTRLKDELVQSRRDELDLFIRNEREARMEALREEMQQKIFQANESMRLKEKKLEEDFEKKKTAALEQLGDLYLTIEDYENRQRAINEAIIREKEIQEQQDFYRVVVTEKDQIDIQVLQDVIPRLNHREAISKLIWDLYIRRPVQEMAKRVTNGRKISGIYKITYVKTGESYIGKTSNITERWTHHCKTVCGLDGAAHSTLHTHMEINGLWNYTFEILEEVERDKLSEREAYYIDFYDTKNYGLNMRRGG